MKLNNKGQSLVAFIIILPIILFVMAIVIDIGLMGVQKRKVNNVIKSTIEYGLKHNSSEEWLKEMIDKNIKYQNIEIAINEDIYITLEYEYDQIFGFIKDNKVQVRYHGTKENGKVKIEED